jgi:hypothetical protein
LPFYGPPPVGKDGAGWSKAQGLKHCWPINGVGCKDIFADEMDGIIPQGGKCLIVSEKSGYTHIVNKGIEPHIGYIVRVKREWNTP